MGYGKQQLEVPGYRGPDSLAGTADGGLAAGPGVGAAVAAGAMTEDAANGAGVPSPVGFRWFRHAGGANPRLPETVSGRYLSSDERRTYFVSERLRLGGKARCGGLRAIPAHRGLRSHGIVKRHHRVIRWRPWWSEPTGIVASLFAEGPQTIALVVKRSRRPSRVGASAREPISQRFPILPASPAVCA
jgi:hypothetical protein